ncbi:diguanylate cyclase (GGDEF) domain-containing protein [Sphaerochaeta pleomorpha str. Grapes]|uniref:Diguanylate cyclase (GGDEF) domain-containing protein n=1 Tax=Sphaerochaeta pleomorpha (strain ATCC BAA-1885 / DSM 22778 / Grapes) TaxID=158190 RepID=G8QY75_SPHPG|nr:GGDEF and EAL domain-containing protein [Sphaerochaeta pleomorpha]AEV29640.1 diguanylate cyclase (GGDEF) domain-containing protein [Sphaerochaeta pleomorpha str. Grapes]
MIDSSNNILEVILLFGEIPENTTVAENLPKQIMVTFLQSAEDSLKYLSKATVITRLVILDLIHYKKQGLDFLRLRKDNSLVKDIPVLSMTLPNDLDSVIKAFELGSSDYFTYPISPELLNTRILELLENKKKQKECFLLEEPNFGNSENGVAFFTYTRHCLTPLYANSKVLEQHQFPSSEEFCSGIPNALDLFGADIRPQLESKIEKAIETQGSFTFFMKAHSLQVQMSWLPYLYSGAPVFLLVSINNYEQDAKQKELVTMLELDSLTGLYNREAFYRKTENLIKENPETTYLYIRWNVVRFKMINDRFGNTKGNSVLRHLAKGFLNWVNQRGVCGRFYSDQFAICMPKNEFDPEQFSRFSVELLHETCLTMNLQMSFGMYEIQDISLPVERMNDRAKLAMRSIKENDTDPYCYYSEAMRNKVLSAQKIMDSFENALNTKQFIIYLQPIYNIHENKFISAEALVRWITPENGMVAPLEFIPLFEENGFIQKLDLYVLEQVCILQRSLLTEGKKPIPISSNLSRVDFFNPDLYKEIIAIVDTYELPHSLIKLEITETAYMDNPKQLLQTISVLQKHGFEILMDDFGSGYSSLNTLQKVPIDILKLDQLFTSEIGTSNKAETIIQNIVNMALGINLQVVAEGIETQEQANFYRSIGCNTLQGYFFSKPISENDYRLLVDSDAIKQPIPKHLKSLTLPTSNLFFRRYGKLLQTVFLTIFELNTSRDTFKTIYANSSFTALPFGTAGALSEMESKVIEKLIHADDQKHYHEETTLFLSKNKGKTGSYHTSEFRMLNCNGFYISVFRIIVKTKNTNGENLFLTLLAKKEDRKLASAIMESIKDLEDKKKKDFSYSMLHEEPETQALG